MPIRPAVAADAEAIARVHVDSWRATYRGMVPDTALDNLSYAKHAEFWRTSIADTDRTVNIVAETEDGGVVGFVCGGHERTGDPDFTGELYAIYLDPAHKGLGIGKKLVNAFAATLRERGHRSMLVWVLADNPACGFYEALGAEYVRETTITIGGAELLERAYGWRNIETLVTS